MLEYRNNVFGKGYLPNWSEDVFVIGKIKNTVPRTYVIRDLKDKEVVGTLYKKELQKKKKNNKKKKKKKIKKKKKKSKTV